MSASPRLQNSANIATIVASAAGIITFLAGFLQFRETQVATRETLFLQREALEQERESKAVDLLVKYNELMKESHSATDTFYSDPEFWTGNLALSIAESIFILRKHDAGWRETVIWILQNHETYVDAQNQKGSKEVVMNLTGVWQARWLNHHLMQEHRRFF